MADNTTAPTSKRLNPLRFTLKDTNETITLDFDKESVMFAQNNGFKTEEVTDYLTLNVPKFFYYACRMHHRNLALNQTNSILKKIGGMTPKTLRYLIALFNQAEISNNVVQDDADLKKNSNVVVEMDDLEMD